MRGVQIGWKRIELADGYHARFDGATLRNGDACTGHVMNEYGYIIFICIERDTGLEYETTEMPCIRLDFTNPIHVKIIA